MGQLFSYIWVMFLLFIYMIFENNPYENATLSSQYIIKYKKQKVAG